jgi:hypothetical protein
MTMRYLFPTILLLLLTISGFSQTFLTGKVRKKETSEILISVSIQNLSLNKYDLSDEGGNYRIPAREGDVLTFSSVGYLKDTLVVSKAMLSGDNPVFLEPRVVELPTFEVGSASGYQQDSIERRQEYKWIYDHGTQEKWVKERKGDGVGVSMNIFRGSSHEEKDWDKLKKRLIKEEEQHYIDYRYSREYVSRLTHLQGDSLQKFMELYRPTYDYARKAAQVDILVFINDSYKKFQALPASTHR